MFVLNKQRYNSLPRNQQRVKRLAVFAAVQIWYAVILGRSREHFSLGADIFHPAKIYRRGRQGRRVF
jgi:hypothetical protein